MDVCGGISAVYAAFAHVVASLRFAAALPSTPHAPAGDALYVVVGLDAQVWLRASLRSAFCIRTHTVSRATRLTYICVSVSLQSRTLR